MGHPDTAQIAAVGGALGSVLVLLARGRLPLLAGLVLLALAEAGMALAFSGGGGLDSLKSAAGGGAPGVGGHGGRLRAPPAPRPAARFRPPRRPRRPPASPSDRVRPLQPLPD